MEIVIPRRTNKLNKILIDESEKILPWKCSKIEVLGPNKKFEVLIDDKWYQLMKIDNQEVHNLMKSEFVKPDARENCNDTIPDNQLENAHNFHFQKCWSYMMTEAFAKVYQNNTQSKPPASSNLVLHDEQNVEILRSLSWSKMNWSENHKCVAQMGPKNVLHRTGFRGMLPIFHSQAQIFNPFNPFSDMTRVDNDFDSHTNSMLGHSENLINRLEHIFEKELPPHHHHSGDGDEHHSFKHREHEHGHSHHHNDEIKKMKMDHEMEKIAQFGEREKLKVTQAKQHTLQLMEYGLVVLIIGLLFVIQQQINNQNVKRKGNNYEDAIMNNF